MTTKIMNILLVVAILGLLIEVQSWCLRAVMSEKGEIREVDWAADNTIFVTANRVEKVVRVYDARTFEVVRVYENWDSGALV